MLLVGMIIILFCSSQDRVYVQGNEILSVYDLGLILFKDEVRTYMHMYIFIYYIHTCTCLLAVLTMHQSFTLFQFPSSFGVGFAPSTYKRTFEVLAVGNGR